MAEAKTYLNVPYAQKDAAKALGARWDAANKKWYVPADKDVALFAQWQVLNLDPSEMPVASNPAVKAEKPGLGATTWPADKNFVPYSGDEPPWD